TLSCAAQQHLPAHVRFGSKADIHPPSADVRFTPESRHQLGTLGCPLCAKSGHMHHSIDHCYSISSSARPSSDIGTVRPSALAVLRLMTSSNLVARSTGRSAGLSPFRMRAV